MSPGFRILRAAPDAGDGRRRVLNVIPHPDDEAIGCPATMRRLQDLGFDIEVLAVGFGRPGQEDRRRSELLDSAERAGFSVLAPDEPINLSDRSDPARTQARVRELVEPVCAARRPSLVLAPHPHDAHPAHELVGRAVVEALERAPAPATLWLWSLWADLARPTLYSPFDEARMVQVLGALEAHQGELARNDYRTFVRGRAMASRVVGSERVFGFGSEAAHRWPHAELLTEVARRDGRWMAGVPRVLEAEALAEPGPEDVTWLLHRPSYAAEASRSLR